MNSPERRTLYAEYEKQLTPFSTSLVAEFIRSADAVGDLLSDDELKEWAEEGLDLARQSWRSWEAAGEYFRVAPQMLPMLGWDGFRRWGKHGRDLAELSSALAASYFRASPATLPSITFVRLGDWVNLGRLLYKGTWRSASLAVQFFDGSPAFFSEMTLEEARVLVRFVDALCDRSYDLASHCLSIAPHVLQPLGGEDRAAFLQFAEALASTGWADARSYLEKGPALLAHVHSPQRVRFLALSRELARREGRQAFTYFAEAARALSQIDAESHGLLLSLSEELVDRSPVSAMEFLKTAATVLERIPLDEIALWHKEGSNLLEQSIEGGEAYFRLESSKGEEMLESLSSRVDLSRVSDILRMYCKALTGYEVAVHSAEALAEKGIGWVETEAPSTEGTAIFLPPWVEEFRDKDGNFHVYKVYSTHQAGHLEFGTFDFEFEREGRVFEGRRADLESNVVGARHPTHRGDISPMEDQEQANGGPGSAGASPLRPDSEPRPEPTEPDLDVLESAEAPPGRVPLTDMERFFDLFPDRRLASDLFAVVEDARIDVLISKEYAGIRRVYAGRQQWELDRRPAVEQMPLRQAFVENLVRTSLDGLDRIVWPSSLLPLMQEAVGVVETLRQPQALVEDAAEATLRLYQLAQQIPNLTPEMMDDWEDLDEDALQTLPMTGDTPGDSMNVQMPQGESVPYESPQPVDFRGDFKPETVQLLMKLRQERGEKGPVSPLSPEQLKQMLEKSVEITLSDMAEADLTQSSELFLTNLLKELNAQEQEKLQKQPVPLKDGQPVTGFSTADDEHELAIEPKYYFYDEWDFRAGDYRPRWCRIVEYAVGEGNAQYFDQTLAKHSALVQQTRRQFELLRPEMFRKIKRLLDGEEIDFDAVTDYAVERKTGHTPTDKIYWRRNKIERDVSVAFLLDMSASTDEEIAKHERRYAQDEFDDDPRRYFSWWMARRAQELLTPPKRIIDLEKESIVLLIKALETIGDTYGIYGFSGYGRENVEFYVVKDIEETFGEHVKRRIDKIAPVRSTRMGPAIRHATWKLDQRDSKVRILFLVSDGRPQDHGYGRDRTEKEYAIHDTHMALLESKRKGITPFCMTVDRYGHDYLKQMCADIGYAVVPDIESMPSRITTLYRELTA
jgi:nitric oxide reductase NorD protein